MIEGQSQRVYRAYGNADEVERVRTHYEQPAEFFLAVLGGNWQAYSCNVWEGASSIAESEERKLDLLAEQMQLQEGQRILDMGCGFGGPLVYLAETYGVSGVGVTASSVQQEVAQARAEEHGVNATFHGSHWRDYESAEPFDALYSDEVIVHFADLDVFFEHARFWLKDGGRMVHKELHFATPEAEEAWLNTPTKAMVFLDEFFGETGNYRLVRDEIALAEAAGFEHESTVSIDLESYRKTVDTWFERFMEQRSELEPIVGGDYFKRYRTWLRLVQRLMRTDTMTLDVITSVAAQVTAGGGAATRTGRMA